MNISLKSKEKLIKMRRDFYEEMSKAISQKEVDEGCIAVRLDSVENEYTYYYKTTDYIIVNIKPEGIFISDNFDENDEQTENTYLYALIKCRNKIKNIILKEVDSYIDNNKLIDKL